jgi:hypothetical protein
MRQKTEQTVKIKLMGWHQHIARNYYYTFIKVSVPLSATSGAKNMWRIYPPWCQDTSYLFRFADRFLHTK